MAEYRTQHYVPKCLLKGFISSKNGKNSLVLYNINFGEMKIRNLKKLFLVVGFMMCYLMKMNLILNIF